MANPQPTYSQPETIGPHLRDKKMAICGQPATNPQLLVRILGTKKWESIANPQPLANLQQS
jgi:hypothetical protein